MQEPKIGDIAICKQGDMGLILKIQKELINGHRKSVYKGIHLNEDRFGSNWESTKPFIVCDVEGLNWAIHDYIANKPV